MARSREKQTMQGVPPRLVVQPRVVGGKSRAKQEWEGESSSDEESDEEEEQGSESEHVLHTEYWEVGHDTLGEEIRSQGERRYLKFLAFSKLIEKTSVTERTLGMPCFCSISDEAKLTCKCRVIDYFVGYYKCRGCNAGSCSTYLGNVKNWSSGAKLDEEPYFNRAERRYYQRLKKCLDLQYARTREAKTVAFTSAEGNKILAKVASADGTGVLGVCLYMMALTGLRFSDLGHIEYRDISVEEYEHQGKTYHRIGLTIRRGKNYKKAQDTRNCWENTHRCLINQPPGFAVWLAGVVHLKDKDKDKKAFPMTTATANRKMRKAKCEGTTYGYRKHYAARVWVEEEGDKVKVASRMGHANLKMADAFYRSLADSRVEGEYRVHLGKPLAY
jgi:integrase